jgi:hypothetical protein
VATISGDIDAANIDDVLDYASLLTPTANTATLDLIGVGFSAVQSISLLIAVDALCRTAEVPWTLIPGHAVSRVIRLTNRDTNMLPTPSERPGGGLTAGGQDAWWGLPVSPGWEFGRCMWAPVL